MFNAESDCDRNTPGRVAILTEDTKVVKTGIIGGGLADVCGVMGRSGNLHVDVAGGGSDPSAKKAAG